MVYICHLCLTVLVHRALSVNSDCYGGRPVTVAQLRKPVNDSVYFAAAVVPSAHGDSEELIGARFLFFIIKICSRAGLNNGMLGNRERWALCPVSAVSPRHMKSEQTSVN